MIQQTMAVHPNEVDIHSVEFAKLIRVAQHSEKLSEALVAQVQRQHPGFVDAITTRWGGSIL